MTDARCQMTIRDLVSGILLRAPLTSISHRLSSRGRRGAVPSGVFDLEIRLESSAPSADGARAPRSRREEEVDARASSTTSNEEIGHETPIGPEGRGSMARLRRCHPSAMKDIAVVAAPRIRTHGARNGRCWGPRPDLAGRGARTCSTSSTPRRENTAGCGASASAAGSW